MPVPTSMQDLSTTAATNSPAGSESPISTDNHHRATQAILRHTQAKGADIASATTTDIGAATGRWIDVTGTTTITGLGTVSAGIERIVRFTGALTLTHNATSLILPGSANITTANGDFAWFESLGSGNWVCSDYVRKDGSSVAGDSRVQNQSANYALATGTATAVTASPSPAYGAVAAGQSINLTMPNAATGVAMTLQLTGQAALPVKTNEGLDPTWAAGFKAILELNTGATQWVLKNPIARATSVQVRQTVLSGAVDANGLPSFGGSTGSTTVTTATTLISTTANGFDAFGAVNRIGSITNPSWTSLSTNGTMYLYLDIAADGTCTTGSTTLAPVYQFGGTYSVTNAQFTFNIQEMVGKVGNGSVATQTHRIFVGEVTVAGAVVTAIAWYALMGRYDSGYTNTLVGAAGTYTKNHNVGTNVVRFDEVIECITTEQNYIAGDIIFNPFTSGGGLVNPAGTSITRNTYVNRRGTTTGYNAANMTTGTYAGLTAANWKYKIVGGRCIGGIPW